MTDKQHEADLARVQQQNSLTDVIREIDERPSGLINNMMRSAVEASVTETPYGAVVHGRTNFENYALNDMIDLVEQTSPEDLTSSGEALYKARTAIEEAAGELKGHIDRVHWVGESGDAFRKWGRSLVASTEGLAEYAAGAADQITAAATGLAEVRTAMPERDTRAVQTLPKAFPEDEKVAGNEDYAAAVKAEKNRQEAINQMNRLSSYYAVSREQLRALPAPTFQAMPDVGVPKPSAADEYLRPTDPQLGAVQGGTAEGLSGRRSTVVTEEPDHLQDARSAGASPHTAVKPADYPDAPVGTTIDSVRTPLPAPGPAPAQVLPNLPPPTEGPGPNGPFATGYTTPVPPTRQGRTGGTPNGVRPPQSAQGRMGSGDGRKGSTGPGRPVGQGPLDQIARGTTTGQPGGARGIAPGVKPLPMNHGVSGGTARANPASSGTTGGPVTGAGRASGVVGGRPGAVPGSAPRLPQGSTVGGQAASGQPRRTAGDGAGARHAQPRITGMPAVRTSAAEAGRKGMTRGGAGLVRGSGGRGRSREEREERGAQRPDYLVEDEETHLPTNSRRDVPPVVN